LVSISREGSPTADRHAEKTAAPGKRATRVPEIMATIKRFDDRGGLLTLEMELVNESNGTSPFQLLNHTSQQLFL
jgi:hypothetical protein